MKNKNKNIRKELINANNLLLDNNVIRKEAHELNRDIINRLDFN